MENCMMTSPQLIADSYERYHFSVYLYLYNLVDRDCLLVDTCSCVGFVYRVKIFYAGSWSLFYN